MRSHCSFSPSGFFMLFLAIVMPFGLRQSSPVLDPSLYGSEKGRFHSSSENAPSYTGCSAQSTAIVNGDFEQEVVEIVNRERAAQGLPPLKRSPQLDEAARYHAADMVEDNYFDHNSYDRVNNQLQLACDWATRLGNFYTGSSTMGENLAYGYSSPEDVMEGWMNSPGHRSNILSTSYTEIGVGYVEGDTWTEDFGSRPNVHPVIINSEAKIADNQGVTLFVYGAWKEIRIRNDSASWSAWIPFQSSLPWQLPNQAGQHTVTVEMRSGTKSESSSDEIYLNGVSEPANHPQPRLFLPLLVNPRP